MAELEEGMQETQVQIQMRTQMQAAIHATRPCIQPQFWTSLRHRAV